MMELIFRSFVTSIVQILLSILVLVIAIGGMAIGVVFGRSPLQGSCSGNGGCEVCTGNHACHQEPVPIRLPK
ncbi:MAG: hypothetical protein ACE5D1_09745 [Fidelibacterota bacterium]